ncbi:hypothetical protein [Hymenobacter cheonanensis]|uniref:hypothetical protein n=1 Tax=Hymenobacter sp. CA2-7 TaxID=3063993 RepID=UPI002713AF25|nr:hypothetical protein [Hymenobacter sp. CA2-7]MDO7885339.1 hypothetical protein [Hymenobacter sp. CA2-7]
MPLEFTSAGKPVHLAAGTSVQLELNSPLFDEDTIKGAFSYSFGIPAAPNGPLYGFPERPDGASQPGAQLPAELALDGLPLLTGSQRVKSASPSKYSVSVQAGLSGANLSERPLSSFAYGGLREVPRWVALPGLGVQYPGLVRHANEVVASPADYGYVFAPLRNEEPSDFVKSLPGFDPKNIDPLDYPSQAVNTWLVRGGPVLGMPGGGSFTYYINFTVPGGVVVQEFRLLPAYCPFPKLRYVLQAICEESGLGVDLGQLLPGELGELVLVSNAVLVDRGDAETLRFSLADVVPELTVAQLLAALRQDFGIVVYVEQATRRVRTAYLVERVAASAAYVDLSARLAGPPEVSVDAPAGLTLTTAVDSSDALTKDLLSLQPAASLVLPAVATVADLPATAVILTENPQPGQARLVTQLDTWYACTLSYRDAVSVNLTWAPLVVNLPPVPVAGGGQEQAQATSYTVELLTRLADDPGVTALVPALSQEPYAASQPNGTRSAALRLLFYNGLQPASDGVSLYPQLSHQSASGAYSVRLYGPAGTYAQWLRDWLPVKLRASSYKQPLLLTPLDLARLDLTQPLRLAGVPYLVRKLSATLPLSKPATAELVRLF